MRVNDLWAIPLSGFKHGHVSRTSAAAVISNHEKNVKRTVRDMGLEFCHGGTAKPKPEFCLLPESLSWENFSVNHG